MGDIFPVVRDRAPLLDRIRNDNDGSSVAEDIGKVVGKLIKTDNEEKVDQAREGFADSFSQGLSNELGVPQDNIDNEFVVSLREHITDVDEFDVLDEDIVEELGLKESDDEEDSDEDNESFSI